MSIFPAFLTHLSPESTAFACLCRWFDETSKCSRIFHSGGGLLLFHTLPWDDGTFITIYTFLTGCSFPWSYAAPFLIVGFLLQACICAFVWWALNVVHRVQIGTCVGLCICMQATSRGATAHWADALAIKWRTKGLSHCTSGWYDPLLMHLQNCRSDKVHSLSYL